MGFFSGELSNFRHLFIKLHEDPPIKLTEGLSNFNFPN